MSRLLHFCLLTLLFASEGGALDPSQRLNQLHHTSWTAKDGLTGSSLCLAQTADGFLWIGTTDGLFRFDGVSIRAVSAARRRTARAVSIRASRRSGRRSLGRLHAGPRELHQPRRPCRQLFRAARVCPSRKSDRLRARPMEPCGRPWSAAWPGSTGGRWQKIRMDWNYPCRSAWRLSVDRQGTCGSQPQVPTESTSFRRARGSFRTRA